MEFILKLIILVYSVILHEISHGFVADKLGDPTARISKRLSLDPRVHIDPLMTIIMPLFLILSGSPVVFGAAKPVPIDPFNFREPKKDTALTAVAGPITNILIAFFFSLILRVLETFFSSDHSLIFNLVLYGLQINVFLAVFNLLPIPPMDGFKFVGGLLPDEYAKQWYQLENYGMIFLVIILFMFSSLINKIVLPISTTIIHVLLQ